MARWSAGRSQRTDELPANWPALRRACLARDGHQCTARMDTDERCPDRATDADHIGDRLNHTLDNLRSLCAWHHHHRTGHQGAAATNAQRAKFTHPWTR